MKNFVFSIIFFFFWHNIYSQSNRDTLVLKVDEKILEIKIGKGFYSAPWINCRDSLSYTYSIRIPNKPIFVFNHYIQSKKTLDYFNSKNRNPVKETVDKSYLEDKYILDINFFREKTFEEIQKLFLGKDFKSLEDDPFLWLYDVNEIKNNKILLREVRYVNHLYE